MRIDDKQQTYDMNPVTKGIFGFIGAIVTAATIGTWTTVNNLSLSSVKTETKLDSMESKITDLKDINKERLKEISTRLNQLDSRVSNLETRK